MTLPPNNRKAPRLLGVFAHPDDETFCAGGTLAKYAAAGAEVMVVCATRGEAGQIRDPAVATRRTLGDVRTRELHHACHHLGVNHVICLDFGDGQLDAYDRDLLSQHISDVLVGFAPDVVITFGTDGVYGHPDHIAIGAATDDAFMHIVAPRVEAANGLMAPTSPRLYHSSFPRNQNLLLEHLVGWLKSQKERFCGTADFAQALRLIAEEATMLGHSCDHIQVEWYPGGTAILEQGEPPYSLYFILSGEVEVWRDTHGGQRDRVGALGPGAFFGEDGIAARAPRNASIIARDSVSCLVFSPGEPSAFAGRGSGHLRPAGQPPGANACPVATTRVDISRSMSQKLKAIAAHRMQCPITPELLPNTLWEALFTYEHFARIYPRMELEADLFPVVTGVPCR